MDSSFGGKEGICHHPHCEEPSFPLIRFYNWAFIEFEFCSSCATRVEALFDTSKYENLFMGWKL